MGQFFGSIGFYYRKIEARKRFIDYEFDFYYYPLTSSLIVIMMKTEYGGEGNAEKNGSGIDGKSGAEKGF